MATEQGQSSFDPSTLEILPVAADRWADLAELFERPGPRGGRTPTSGCWCMFWRLPRKEFDVGWGKGESRGVGNREAMASIVAAGGEPGLLAYDDGTAVAWCSVAPRSSLPGLEAAKALPRIDDEPVWSIVCFYIARDYQGRGVAEALIRAAIEHAAARGAQIVEAYGSKPTDDDPFTGHERLFEKMGFTVVRPGGRRSTMRYEIGGR